MFKTATPFFEKLSTIINEQILKIKHNEIETLYAKWAKEFSEDLDFLSDKRSKDLIREFQNVPEHSCLTGIDLPTWFGDFENKKVVFLGIDPMRNDRDFQNLDADINKDLIVGTPYAFHIKSFRENRTNPYWQVINIVAKSNFVYVTDIYKTFFYTDNTKKIRSYDFWNKTENNSFNENHRKLLIDEINLIEPDIIVTFGALAYKVLTNQKYCPKLSQSLSHTSNQIQPFSDKDISSKSSIKILPLMHLSGSTRGKHLEAFFLNNNIKYSDKDDKRIIAGSLYGQMINDFIEKK
jgi:hypothetical protein